MSAALVPQIELLGSYGLNEEFEYIEEGSGLRVLKKLESSFDFNLLDGYTGNNSSLRESYEKRDKMGNAAIWMVKHRELISSERGDKPFNVDFVCGNGLFKKLLNFPFELPQRGSESEKHEFAVSKYKGVIFIKRIEDKEDERVLNGESSYAGCKFEDFVSEKLDNEDEGQKYYNMLKAKFGDHVLLYSCEVDCIKERLERDPEIDDFVEVKTAAPIRDKYSGSFTEWFRKTVSRRWWVQCIMAGITQIVVGIKDQPRGGGYIHCKKVERVAVNDLERNAIGWSSKEAFQMLDKFLKKIKEVVTKDNPDIVYLFTIETGREIAHEKLTAHDHEEFPVITEAMVEKLDEIE